MTAQNTHFNELDLNQIKAAHLDNKKVQFQIQAIINGGQFTRLNRPSVIGDGIKLLSEGEITQYIEIFHEQKDKALTIKFVPASGAASRMFRLLFKILEKEDSRPYSEIEKKAQDGDDDSREFIHFFENLRSFAFYQKCVKCMKDDGLNPEKLYQEKDYTPFLDYLLNDKGLNYADFPKGLIDFHAYPDCVRTAFEEHLIEGKEYSCDNSQTIHVHFTVASDYEKQIKERIAESRVIVTSRDETFNITYSSQKNSTDAICLDENNQCVRDENGHLIFRPGGHGALIENLNDLSADILFVKNIDNIVPDGKKEDTITYKKALAGYLFYTQDKIFSILRQIEEKKITALGIKESLVFLEETLLLDVPDSVKSAQEKEEMDYLFEILNRPIRVCGMVKNEGEPGGGPAWVENSDGRISLQIVEKSQINFSDKSQGDILRSATHFNPVDLVCGVRNFKGEDFNLLNYVDHSTCFISQKSLEDKVIKTFEWPGLWNGAMADWITLFVEVPISTFAPVKTINDLLRDEHQP